MSPRLVPPLRYFAKLSNGRIVLWCYLLWYLSTVAHHFDASPRLWLNALGISALIGVALMLSVGGGLRVRANPWQTARLFMMPFCVSSFSSLIKNQNFMLIFPPGAAERVHSLGICAVFVLAVLVLRRVTRAGEAAARASP